MKTITPNINFSFKKDDIEIRLTDSLDGRRYPEIVKWFDEHSCYTIAYWTCDKDGNWSLKLLDERFFESFPNGIPNSIWKAIISMSTIVNTSDWDEDDE